MNCRIFFKLTPNVLQSERNTPFNFQYNFTQRKGPQRPFQFQSPRDPIYAVGWTLKNLKLIQSIEDLRTDVRPKFEANRPVNIQTGAAGRFWRRFFRAVAKSPRMIRRIKDNRKKKSRNRPHIKVRSTSGPQVIFFFPGDRCSPPYLVRDLQPITCQRRNAPFKQHLVEPTDDDQRRRSGRCVIGVQCHLAADCAAPPPSVKVSAAPADGAH